MTETELRQKVVATAKKYIGCATNRNVATSVYENLVNKNIDAIFLFIAPPTN